MATFDGYQAVDFRAFTGLEILNDAGASYTTATATSFQGGVGNRLVSGLGTGFTYAGGKPVDGQLTSLTIYVDNLGVYNFGFSLAPVDLSDLKADIAAAPPGDLGGVLAKLLAGNDVIGASQAATYDDWIRGFEGNDQIWGYFGKDVLYGDAGNDTLYGGNGRDRLFGGADDDRLVGGRGVDRLDGGAGSDTADFSDMTEAVVVTLKAGKTVVARVGGKDDDLLKSIENLRGGESDDRLTGDRQNNRLEGEKGKDKLVGLAGADVLKGGDGNDVLDGGKGLDTLHGGRGKDILTGGSGQDFFVFDTDLGPGNVDRITDFKPGVDRIYLSKAIFTSFTAPGAIDAGNLAFGKAADADDYLIYRKGTGKLYYDADGSNAGYAPVLFAQLKAGTSLSAADIHIMA